MRLKGAGKSRSRPPLLKIALSHIKYNMRIPTIVGFVVAFVVAAVYYYRYRGGGDDAE